MSEGAFAVTSRKAFTTSIFLVDPTRYSVLLVLHKRWDLWLPVGGELDEEGAGSSEEPLQGAIREVNEETGISLSPGDFPKMTSMPYSVRGMFGFEQHTAGDRGLHMNFCFLACTEEQAIKLCDEHIEAGWFPLMGKDNIATTSNVSWCLNYIDRYLRKHVNPIFAVEPFV